MNFFKHNKFFKQKESRESTQGNLYILCQEENSNSLLQAIDAVFGTQIADGGVNNGTLSNGGLTIQLVAYGQDLGKECIDFIRNQVNTVCGHFAAAQTQLTDIRTNALHQLTGSKGLLIFRYSYPGPRNQETDSMICTPLYAVLGRVHGLLLTMEGTRLMDEKGRLVFSDQGESELEWYMPYERPLPENFFDGAPADSLRRRNESLAAIRSRHIHVTEWLPLIEDEKTAHMRTPEEIARRAAALMIVSLYSEDLLQEKASIEEAKEFIRPIIQSYGAGSDFSEKEKNFLEKDSTEQERIQFIWQYEPLLVMLWALGYVEDLFFPDHICDVPALVRIMKEHDSIPALVENAKPRSLDELLSAADMIYRLDWACVDARIHNLPAPCAMDSGVVMERHRALNWLISDADWDNVDIST